MTIDNNLQKLVEKISEIPEIQEVATYFKSMENTPQAIILYRSSVEDVISTLNVKIINTFKIIVRSEFKNTENQETYARLLSQLVLDKINTNRNLDKTVEFVNIDSIVVDWEESDEKTKTITIDVSIQNFNSI